jgi:hypothetical protein
VTLDGLVASRPVCVEDQECNPAAGIPVVEFWGDRGVVSGIAKVVFTKIGAEAVDFADIEVVKFQSDGVRNSAVLVCGMVVVESLFTEL